MPGYTNLKAAGLNVSPNSLNKPEGSLEVASNVIIRRDNVIEPRRGFKVFGTALPSSGNRVKQLIVYKNRILRHYAAALQFDSDGSGTFSTFNSTFTEADSAVRTKSLEANSNLYFTSSDGIKKISATTASEFSTSPDYITDAGGIKAVDLTAILDSTYGSTTGFLPQDSAVAYRVVWGTKDVNTNLILGAPSQRTEVYNEMIRLMLTDYAYLLDALDRLGTTVTPTPIIGKGTYVNSYKLPNTATPSDLKNKLELLVAAIDDDILYADNVATAPIQITSASVVGGVSTNICTIVTTGADPGTYLLAGSKIRISGFADSVARSMDGIYTVSGTTALSITFNTNTQRNLNGSPVVGSVTTGACTLSTPKVNSGTYEILNFNNPIGTIDSPTPNSELVLIQDYMNLIIQNLKLESDGTAPLTGVIISSLNQSTYIAPLTVTTSSNVILNITVPVGVTTNDFYQVYRSDIAQAQLAVVLDDLILNDEMQLIFEEYYSSGTSITFTDITPDVFRGANLYTNEASGEGILQSNDIPPFAKDINSFKGSTFYSNCRTRYRLALSVLLNIDSLVTEYNAGRIPKVTISNGTTNQTYNFIKGIQEKFTLDFTTGGGAGCDATSLTRGAVPGYYFTFYSANDKTKYAAWYKVVNETMPIVANATMIQVTIPTGSTKTQVANYSRDFISKYIEDFTCSVSSDILTVETIDFGYTTNAVSTDMPVTTTLTTTVNGQGEQASSNSVLLSAIISPSIAVDETARSFVRVINKNVADSVYAYYVSGTNSVPGQIQLESRILSTTPFYIQANNTVVGANFNPDISPLLTIDTISEVAATSIHTESVHNMVTGDRVFITNSDASCVSTFVDGDVSLIPNTIAKVAHGLYTGEKCQLTSTGTLPGGLALLTDYYVIASTADTYKLATTLTLALAGIAVDITSVGGGGTHTLTATFILNGIFTITRISDEDFTIPVRVTSNGAGTGTGRATRVVDAIVAENNQQVNRVYYSKYQQPEAVPQLNYYDVGARDKKILRIFPLRDSLFIFKEDGLFRISGETLPFSLALFDSSCVLVAPDSVSLLDNNIYCFTQKGISQISEAGVNTISRAIDTEILKLLTYSNFKTASWATAYESDNSYMFWTLKKPTDTSANICYRYSLLTSSWTTFDKENTCGVINQFDDKLYLGAGDTNYIEQERKAFTRQDYADREYSTNLTSGNYYNNILHFNSITNFAIGDVLEQTQSISLYTYNMLLKKLDLDSGITDNDYYSTLVSTAGVNLRIPITNLTTKLDSDIGISHRSFQSPTDVVGSIITLNSHGYYTGMRLKLSTTSALPAPLLIATTYYLIVTDSNHFKLAASLNDANSGTNIILTTSGTGTQTVLSEDYTFLTENKPTSTISAISIGNGTVEITTSNSHGLITGRTVVLGGTDSTPSVNGSYTITVSAHNKFTIPASVTILGTTGTYQTDSDDFQDIKACYNKIIERLNSNSVVVYNNYDSIDYDTKIESVIISINSAAKNITLNKTLDYITGPMTLYKAIPTEVRYSPVTGGDPMSLKHIGEATIMFQSRTFTVGVLSFSTDLLPSFVDVNFNVNGNGIFGNGNFGEEWFGGEANAAPVRVYLPRNCQRHRYLNVKFTHAVARESYSIFGITLYGDVTSQRAYR